MINPAKTKRAIKQSLTWAHLNGGLNDAVLLTFDDGPHPESTPVVLELLKQYNARAIFFVVGARIQRAPHLLKIILDEGHAIGNHSYSHPIEKQFWLAPYLRDLKRVRAPLENLLTRGPNTSDRLSEPSHLPAWLRPGYSG